MNSIIAILTLGFLYFQSGLWFGEGGVVENWHLDQEIEAQQDENTEMRERNAALVGEVTDLKNGLEAVEERARKDLNMIKKDETFFQIIEK